MTLVLAVVGIGVTLLLAVAERTREAALLRAIGPCRAGTRSAVAWEAGFAASVVVLGTALGAAYGLLAARALGGAVRPTLPIGQLALLATGVVAVAVLAAVLPAVLAGRVPPVHALQA